MIGRHRRTWTLASASALSGQGQDAQNRTVCDLVFRQDYGCNMHALRRGGVNGCIDEDGGLPIFATVHVDNGSTASSKPRAKNQG